MFLDNVVDEIVEIEFGKSMRYVGNYTHYIKAKEEYLKKNHEAYIRQQQEIQRLETLIDKFRYKKNKAAFAKSKQKYLDRMERIEDSKQDSSRIKANFSSYRKGGKRVLSVEDLKIGYGDNVLSTVSFELFQKQRMGIIGPNMITDLMSYSGYKVISNRKGDNLRPGIVTTIVTNSTILGKVKANALVLEVDELNIRHCIKTRRCRGNKIR